MHTRYGTLARFVLDRKEIYVTKNLNEVWRAYDGEKNKKKNNNEYRYGKKADQKRAPIVIDLTSMPWNFSCVGHSSRKMWRSWWVPLTWIDTTICENRNFLVCLMICCQRISTRQSVDQNICFILKMLIYQHRWGNLIWGSIQSNFMTEISSKQNPCLTNTIHIIARNYSKTDNEYLRKIFHIIRHKEYQIAHEIVCRKRARSPM